MAGWYSRSVFFVADVPAAQQFYVDLLGFTEAWSFDEDGPPIVAQVNRADCEIILALDSGRTGPSRLFIALDEDEMATLRDEIRSKQVPHKVGWWGYPVIEICDPDGNELFFPVEE